MIKLSRETSELTNYSLSRAILPLTLIAVYRELENDGFKMPLGSQWPEISKSFKMLRLA